ncbi:hypothetical protein BH11PSE11_BH11PSE11_27800 [soil metagenome]
MTKEERRNSRTANRRKACRRTQRQGAQAADAVHIAALGIEAIASREKSAGYREIGLLRREQMLILREAAMQRRESVLRSGAQRNREARNAGTNNFACEAADCQLRRVNEQLVIRSIQWQTQSEESEKAKSAMTYMAHHDFLTDLPNRVQLGHRAEPAIVSARQRGENLAVLFLDLDRFKAVNDTFGHVVGDQLLQAVAQRLTGSVRKTDVVSRHGGDEFVLVLTEINDACNLSEHVKAIHQVVSAPYVIAGNQIEIGATIGISIFPADGDDIHALIRNADLAMYHAKSRGRNRCEFYRRSEHELDRPRTEASLYQALDSCQFTLFFQAQIDLEHGAVVGVEALIRWDHPSQGLISPANFMPAAEACGAIVPIGRWVLREACTQAQAWLRDGLSFNVIAVNISAREFEHDDLVSHITDILAETGLAPERLELELTETVLMKDIDRTAGMLDTLRSVGVKISIDDFGTGYSSLNYLKRFSLDTLKIDQSFVHDLSAEDDDILVNAIIDIGLRMKHQVIAEGVETPYQLEFLRKNQCTAAQGFYLNAPMPAGEFSEFLRQGLDADLMDELIAYT